MKLDFSLNLKLTLTIIIQENFKQFLIEVFFFFIKKIYRYLNIHIFNDFFFFKLIGNKYIRGLKNLSSSIARLKFIQKYLRMINSSSPLGHIPEENFFL